MLNAHGRQISRAGTGGGRDHVFVERRWTRIKYEEVSRDAYKPVRAARQGLDRSLAFDNQTRPHRALDGKTPAQGYGDNRTTRRTATESDDGEAPLKAWHRLSKQLGPPLAERYRLQVWE